MGTFNIIPDPRQKIYQEMFVMDGVPDFHPPYLTTSVVRPLVSQWVSESVTNKALQISFDGDRAVSE